MSNLVRTPASSLLERTRNLASISEDELRRFAAEAARDRDAEALWALTEAHLTLHGSSGSRVSRHTLDAYRRGLRDLLTAWQSENLLRPQRNAGVLYVRDLETRLKPASVGVKIAVSDTLGKYIVEALYQRMEPKAALEAAASEIEPLLR